VTPSHPVDVAKKRLTLKSEHLGDIDEHLQWEWQKGSIGLLDIRN
jgi:hypothetical protein